MAAGTYNIFLEQGATFTLNFEWRDDVGALRDLTGYTARMQVRATIDAITSIVDLTTSNGKITIDEPNGKITLTLTAAQTEVLPTTVGVYDLEVASAGGIVTRLIQGTWTVSPEVTRIPS